MIKGIEIFLNTEVREFTVGKNCKEIKEVFEGVHGIRVVTTATGSGYSEEIIFVGVPYVLYIEKK